MKITDCLRGSHTDVIYVVDTNTAHSVSVAAPTDALATRVPAGPRHLSTPSRAQPRTTGHEFGAAEAPPPHGGALTPRMASPLCNRHRGHCGWPVALAYVMEISCAHMAHACTMSASREKRTLLPSNSDRAVRIISTVASSRSQPIARCAQMQSPRRHCTQPGQVWRQR